MQPFLHLHRVTYAECTVGNHVYYSRYLELLEAARGEFFRSLGSPFLEWQERGMAFPVTECRLRYKMPAHYDDLLEIQVLVQSAQGARLSFQYRIFNQKRDLVLEGETFHACTGPNGKPRRIPEELAARLSGHVGV